MKEKEKELKKVHKAVKDVLNGKDEIGKLAITEIIKDELLRMTIREEIKNLKKSEKDDEWRMKMALVIKDGCQINGD